MYCSDELGGLVVDVGAGTARFGFTGDELPKSTFSSVVGVSLEPDVGGGSGSSGGLRKHVSSTTTSGTGGGSSGRHTYRVGPTARIFRPGMDLRPVFDFGIVEDWDALEKIWEYGFSQAHGTTDADALASQLSTRPVMLSEMPYSIVAQREKVAEILFEKFGVPALYLARSPVLSAFSMGRASAVVVDIGASCTRVSPVFDGYVLNKGCHISEVGGNFLTEALHATLIRTGALTEVLPHYAIAKTLRAGVGGADEDVDMAGASKPALTTPASTASTSATPTSRVVGKFVVTRRDVAGITSSYRVQQEHDVLDDLKKSVCTVHETGYDASHPPPSTVYELPDGTTVKVKNAREQVCELLFREDACEPFRALLSQRSTPGFTSHTYGGVIHRQTSSTTHATSMYPIPLQNAIYGALTCVTAEIRRDMCNNVVLAGGGSNLKGLQQRLHWELLALIPAAFKPRVMAASPMEREHAAWIGGSILSSLGTFHQMWVGKLEYEDEGLSALERNVPLMPPKSARTSASGAAGGGATTARSGLEAAASGAGAAAPSAPPADATASSVAVVPEVDERKVRIREAFAIFDPESTGSVPESEVLTVLRALDIFVPDRDFMDHVLTDLHGDEPKPFVQYDAFERVCMALMTARTYDPDGPEVLLAAFRALDPDGLGFIEAERLKALLMELGDPAFSDKEVDAFFKAALDKDTGRVYYEDYIGLMSR